MTAWVGHKKLASSSGDIQGILLVTEIQWVPQRCQSPSSGDIQCLLFVTEIQWVAHRCISKLGTLLKWLEWTEDAEDREISSYYASKMSTPNKCDISFLQ